MNPEPSKPPAVPHERSLMAEIQSITEKIDALRAKAAGVTMDMQGAMMHELHQLSETRTRLQQQLCELRRHGQCESTPESPPITPG